MEGGAHGSDVLFEAAEALQLVSRFLDKEWARTNLSDVNLQQITGGLTNRLHLLTRHNAASAETTAVLIRHFGTDGHRQQQPLESSTTLSTTEQAIVYTEMACRGYGPKLYGTFPGGRLEEWIDSHPLTAAESMDANIRRDIARSYARLHSLQLPLRKDGFELVVSELCHKCRSRKDEVLRFLLALECEPATKCATAFRDVDWSHELQWTSNLFKKHGCRRTFAHGDTNFLNILVKNYESECAVMLIDFETVTYSYRGIDIGGHFTDRMYDWGQPASRFTGYDAPDISEQRSFCESYVQELRDLGQVMTPEDNVGQLLLEARIGRMHNLVFVVLMCLVLDQIEDDPFVLDSVVHEMKAYLRLKREFIQLQRNNEGVTP